MSKNYADDYGKALKYSGADHSTVEHFLNLLSLPEHNHTRWGRGDQNLRMAAADAFRDRGRDEEADLLQGNHHVVIHEGKVKRGRFTLRPLHEFADDVQQEIYNAGDWEAAHPLMHFGTAHERQNHPLDFLPSAEFQEKRKDAYGAHDILIEPHLDDPNVALHDPKTGLPLIRGSCFTCHDFEAPIHKAPQKWGQLLNDTVFHPDNNVTTHLPQQERERIERMVTEGVKRVPIEEPVPEGNSDQ